MGNFSSALARVFRRLASIDHWRSFDRLGGVIPRREVEAMLKMFDYKP
jgi:hypothetical protein